MQTHYFLAVHNKVKKKYTFSFVSCYLYIVDQISAIYICSCLLIMVFVCYINGSLCFTLSLRTQWRIRGGGGPKSIWMNLITSAPHCLEPSSSCRPRPGVRVKYHPWHIPLFLLCFWAFSSQGCRDTLKIKGIVDRDSMVSTYIVDPRAATLSVRTLYYQR